MNVKVKEHVPRRVRKKVGTQQRIPFAAIVVDQLSDLRQIGYIEAFRSRLTFAFFQRERH